MRNHLYVGALLVSTFSLAVPHQIMEIGVGLESFLGTLLGPYLMPSRQLLSALHVWCVAQHA